MPPRPASDRRSHGDPPRRRALSVAGLVAGLLAGLLAGCSWVEDDDDLPVSGTDLGPPPETIAQPEEPGEPGELIFAEPFEEAKWPAGGTAWRMVYWSSTVDGEPVAVTGQVTTPAAPPPEGGWPVVAWGHPTVGTSDRCTPSLEGPSKIHLVDQFTEAGMAVVATDYQGLGTEGAHPYLVGAAAAHDILDATRAATQIEDAGVAPTSPVVIAGFSQGGHAALWAGELASEYAPEMDVFGVFAAAPVTSVAAFAQHAVDVGPFQTGVLVTIAYGFAQAYPELDLADVLSQSSLDRLSIVEDYCIGEAVAGFGQELDVVFDANPLDLDDWRARIDENASGQRGLTVPAHILQGDADVIVLETVTAETVEQMCGHGDPVEYVVIEGSDHAVVTADRVLPWIEARFRQEPPPDTC